MNSSASKTSTGPLITVVVATLFLIAENGLLMVRPTMVDQRVLLIIGAAAAICALIFAFAMARRVPNMEPAQTKIPVVAPPAPKGAVSNEQAVILLSLLQEKGRFIDFVMEDIAPFSNEQVGAAARVVHQGCREVIKDAFNPKSISDKKEKSEIVLEQGFNASEYRVVGKVGTPPYKGTLVHPGWKAQFVKLPRPNISPDDMAAPVILPAEVNI